MVKKPTKRQQINATWNDLTRFKSFWILDEDRVPKVAADMDEWYEFQRRDWEQTRRVGLTDTATMNVSTVFLGVDHNFHRAGPPILFETMTFTLESYPREYKGKISFSRDDLDTVRYSTWDDAEAGHNAIVRRIQKAEADALAGIKRSAKSKNGKPK